MAAPVTTGREAGTLSSLRAVLDVSSVVRSHDDLRRLLEAMAATVAQELGFTAAALERMIAPELVREGACCSTARRPARSPPRPGCRRSTSPATTAAARWRGTTTG